MSTTLILIVLGTIILSVFIYKKISKEESEIAESPGLDHQEDFHEEIKGHTVPAIDALSDKVEKIEETAEEMSKRLSSIKNPDAEKPFAKISVPEIDVPEEAPIVNSPVAKPKRKYKKKPQTKKKDA